MVSMLALSLLLSWIQVSSDNFVVKSSAGEERAKRVLRDLERFHRLVGELVFETTVLPELPIEVLLIGDDQTMKELAPRYGGRRVAVAGYYQRGQDRDFIVLSGKIFPETLTSVVYHELTHYFLSRALSHRPTWLNEGLAEYFSTAEIRDEEIALGALSADRMQLLKTTRPLPLKEFFAVDADSPYYNETLKANVFYAQSWAFVHFLMHSRYAEGFRSYIEILTKSEARLLDHLKVGEFQLEQDFRSYLGMFIQHTKRTQEKVAGETWSMKVESIPDTEAHISIAEIFLADGQLQEARRYLESVAARDPEFSRATYYRGVLAQLSGDDDARGFFVDALLDPQLGVRAAVQLVRMGDLHIPEVRSLLEQGARSGTRISEVYWALAEIYLDDVRRIEETIRLARRKTTPPIQPTAPVPEPAVEPERLIYAEGVEDRVKYRLLAESPAAPLLESFVAPYYPAELLEQELSGEVIVDVQVTGEGKVAGMWLVSSTPEIFGNLATNAIRQWTFEAVPAKIRVVVDFLP